MGIFDNLFKSTTVRDESYDDDDGAYDYYENLPVSVKPIVSTNPSFWLSTVTTTTTEISIMSQRLINIAIGVGIGVFFLICLALFLIWYCRCCRCRVSNISSSAPDHDGSQSDVVVTMSQLTQVAHVSNSEQSTVTQHNKAE